MDMCPVTHLGHETLGMCTRLFADSCTDLKYLINLQQELYFCTQLESLNLFLCAEIFELDKICKGFMRDPFPYFSPSALNLVLL
jgi:hypothetical protein